MYPTVVLLKSGDLCTGTGTLRYTLTCFEIVFMSFTVVKSIAKWHGFGCILANFWVPFTKRVSWTIFECVFKYSRIVWLLSALRLICWQTRDKPRVFQYSLLAYSIEVLRLIFHIRFILIITSLFTLNV